MRPSGNIDLGDRLATAVISGVACAITLTCYFFISRSGHFTASTWIGFREFASLKLCLFAIAAFVVAGFLLGSDRMTTIFSFLWGTSDK
jgi:hypothetical protein